MGHYCIPLLGFSCTQASPLVYLTGWLDSVAMHTKLRFALQFILVNVDFVFRGERGLITAGASTVLLVVTWIAVAYAYSAFSVTRAASDE